MSRFRVMLKRVTEEYVWVEVEAEDVDAAFEAGTDAAYGEKQDALPWWTDDIAVDAVDVESID